MTVLRGFAGPNVVSAVSTRGLRFKKQAGPLSSSKFRSQMEYWTVKQGCHSCRDC
jgi:hypothetical protein